MSAHTRPFQNAINMVSLFNTQTFFFIIQHPPVISVSLVLGCFDPRSHRSEVLVFLLVATSFSVGLPTIRFHLRPLHIENWLLCIHPSPNLVYWIDLTTTLLPPSIISITLYIHLKGTQDTDRLGKGMRRDGNVPLFAICCSAEIALPPTTSMPVWSHHQYTIQHE